MAWVGSNWEYNEYEDGERRLWGAREGCMNLVVVRCHLSNWGASFALLLRAKHECLVDLEAFFLGDPICSLLIGAMNVEGPHKKISPV